MFSVFALSVCFCISNVYDRTEDSLTAPLSSSFTSSLFHSGLKNLTPWIPGLFTDTSELMHFYFLVGFFPLFSCWSHVVY